uniref:NADH-ubiquinone oxidoreductase chain 2 n=1 Tax=Erotylidae sp. BMNH 1274780 TaxID=1796505 RepID=A0A126TGX9_9CUCU|nr:NADH dehydrogenase subunit 2 [Erotylidae sp. BMNH 1274780]
MIKMYKLLFSLTLMIGTMISISSYSWMGMWMGLEINLLSIIPLMSNKFNLYSSETSIKYFIVQAIASTTLMFSIIFMSLDSMIFLNNLKLNMIMIFNFSLLLKMGAAPLHFWFPEVMEGLNWVNSFILLTWQKIAPMLLIIINNNTLFSIIIIFSMLVSGLIGLNQISLRKILAYSSINHISWMLSTLMFLKSLWLIYFLIYTLISLNLIVIFNKFKIYFFKQVFNMINNPNLKLFFILNFFSLGGLPPFLGFFPKWLVIQNMIINNYLFISLIMVILTLLTLYFYMRMTFSSLMFEISTLNFSILNIKKLNLIMMFNFIMLLSLILSTLIINLN